MGRKKVLTNKLIILLGLFIITLSLSKEVEELFLQKSEEISKDEPVNTGNL